MANIERSDRGIRAFPHLQPDILIVHTGDCVMDVSTISEVKVLDHRKKSSHPHSSRAITRTFVPVRFVSAQDDEYHAGIMEPEMIGGIEGIAVIPEPEETSDEEKFLDGMLDRLLDPKVKRVPSLESLLMACDNFHVGRRPVRTVKRFGKEKKIPNRDVPAFDLLEYVVASRTCRENRGIVEGYHPPMTEEQVRWKKFVTDQVREQARMRRLTEDRELARVSTQQARTELRLDLIRQGLLKPAAEGLAA